MQLEIKGSEGRRRLIGRRKKTVTGGSKSEKSEKGERLKKRWGRVLEMGFRKLRMVVLK